MNEQISKDMVVSIAYTLTNAQGRVIDEADEGEAFAFIFGTGSIIPGLESALEGKKVGDALVVNLTPEHAYGDRDEGLVQVLSMDRFVGVPDVAVGMEFQTTHEDHPMLVQVVDMDGDEVTVDGNHPLAGETLNFDVTVVGIREPTSEEIDHGHVHGPGGHHH